MVVSSELIRGTRFEGWNSYRSGHQWSLLWLGELLRMPAESDDKELSVIQLLICIRLLILWYLYVKIQHILGS